MTRYQYMPAPHRQMLHDFTEKLKASGTVRDYVEGACGEKKLALAVHFSLGLSRACLGKPSFSFAPVPSLSWQTVVLVEKLETAPVLPAGNKPLHEGRPAPEKVKEAFNACLNAFRQFRCADLRIIFGPGLSLARR